jgi:CBS-domain-containing membrane protein
MLENRISGLPVTDARGNLVGIVTEGDFLRRREIGTQRRRARWLEFLIAPGPLAAEYVRASGRRIDEVMTPDPYTVIESDSLETAVELMERQNIKRITVLRDGRIVGIVSRANLMHALAGLAHYIPAPAGGDREIYERILATLAKQKWGGASTSSCMVALWSCGARSWTSVNVKP